MTIKVFGLRNPPNIVPACALNVFPHVLHRYRGRFFPWITIEPCPICPLVLQRWLGQNTCDASICSVFVSFIGTAYRSMLGFSTYPDFPPPVSGVLPREIDSPTCGHLVPP